MEKVRDKILQYLGKERSNFTVTHQKMVDVLQGWKHRDVESAYQMYLHLTQNKLTFVQVGEYLCDFHKTLIKKKTKNIIQTLRRGATDREISKASKKPFSRAQARRINRRK